jgi:hypothetical protein
MTLLRLLLLVVVIFAISWLFFCNSGSDYSSQEAAAADEYPGILKPLSIEKEITLDCGTDIIGHIFAFAMVDDNFLIVDSIHSRQCYLFDSKGKLIKKIGKYGEGPGEYLFVMAACYDRERICLVENHKINLYTKKGEFLTGIRIKPLLGLCNGVYAGPNGTLFVLSFNRYNKQKDTIFQLGMDGSLIKSFSPVDDVPAIFDTFYPQTALCIEENRIFQVFNFKYGLTEFDINGNKIRDIKLTSPFYIPPNFAKAKVKGHRAEKKYRASFSQFTGFYRHSNGYVSLLTRWQDVKEARYIYEFFSKDFRRIGYFELKKEESPLGVYNDRIISADFEAETKLIFRN